MTNSIRVEHGQVVDCKEEKSLRTCAVCKFYEMCDLRPNKTAPWLAVAFLFAVIFAAWTAFELLGKIGEALK